MHLLTTIDISNQSINRLGQKNYRIYPRIGEWIELNTNGIGTLYEVVMVVHSSHGFGSKIYIKKIDITEEAIKSLYTTYSAL
ncbi:hypothetical protein ACS77F_07255 [Yersinia enterocolitica]|uniref:hypothetical protein n=1 Tax=Yersinia enterocolitica TaxID=630 RepID=UPI002AC37EB3|nr:hypothetical protein [Yersinia enterocolitica]HEN3319735.1 hypothetical protein [Yersinia enterocolitica]